MLCLFMGYVARLKLMGQGGSEFDLEIITGNWLVSGTEFYRCGFVDLSPCRTHSAVLSFWGYTKDAQFSTSPFTACTIFLLCGSWS